jgi:hypothetical protein
MSDITRLLDAAAHDRQAADLLPLLYDEWLREALEK